MESRERLPVKSARVQRFAIYATVVFAAFLVGFLPMWLVARTRGNERNAAQQALRVAQIENALAAATIQSRRGDYEPARTAASTFYTNLRAELDRADSGFAVPARDALQGSPRRTRSDDYAPRARRSRRRGAAREYLYLVSPDSRHPAAAGATRWGALTSQRWALGG